MRFLILGFLMGLPLLEGALLYSLGQGHGLWVLAWLVFAAAAGVVLIKQARFSLVTRLGSALARGEFSLAAIIDSFRTVLAGLLLIFPGIITDVAAMLLLLLPIREPAHANARGSAAAIPTPGAGGVIEGEFRRER